MDLAPCGVVLGRALRNVLHFLLIIFGSFHMNTLRQTQDNGSYISDDAHAPVLKLLQESSIVNDGILDGIRL